MTFYRCTNCNHVYVNILSHENEPTCCGEKTIPIEHNISFEDTYQHLINVRQIGKFLTITMKQTHPMIDVHHLEFICVETTEGYHLKRLHLDQEVKLDFIMSLNEEVTNIYVYCSVHSLWKFDSNGAIIPIEDM